MNILPQTRHQLEKQLDWENSHLYSKLGLRYPFKEQGGKKNKKRKQKNRPGELLLQHIIVDCRGLMYLVGHWILKT